MQCIIIATWSKLKQFFHCLCFVCDIHYIYVYINVHLCIWKYCVPFQTNLNNAARLVYEIDFGIHTTVTEDQAQLLRDISTLELATQNIPVSKVIILYENYFLEIQTRMTHFSIIWQGSSDIAHPQLKWT